MAACSPHCQVEERALDSSYFANDAIGFVAYSAYLHRTWCRPERIAEVQAVRAAIRALPAAVTFPCSGCGKHAFPGPGVMCFWCGRGR